MIYVWGIAAAMLVTALLSASEMAFIAAHRVRIRSRPHAHSIHREAW